MHKARYRGGGFFRNAYLHTAHFGRQVDNFFRTNGNKIRGVATMVTPLLAPENPALASAMGVVSQGTANYSQTRVHLDETNGSWLDAKCS